MSKMSLESRGDFSAASAAMPPQFDGSTLCINNATITSVLSLQPYFNFSFYFPTGTLRKAETLQGCGCKSRRTQEAFSPQTHKPIRIHSVKARALPRTLFSVSQNLGIKPCKRLQGAVVSVSAIGYWAEVAVYEMRLTSEVLQLLIRFVFWGCT